MIRYLLPRSAQMLLFLVLLGLLPRLSIQAQEQPVYWDVNGSDPGSGGPIPEGVWNLSNARWNSLDGTGVPVVWDNSGLLTAIFSAGSDWLGLYTVTLDAAEALRLSALSVGAGDLALVSASSADVLQFSGSSARINVASGASLRVQSGLESSAGGLTKNGAGLLILDTAFLPSGAYALASGETRLAGGRVLSVSSVTLGGEGEAGSMLTLEAGSVLSLAGGITFSNVGTALPGSIQGAGSIALNGTRTLNVQNIAADADLTISSVMVDGSGVSGLTKAGTGALILTGTQAFTGTTQVSAGSLSVFGNHASLGSSSGLVVSGAATAVLGSAADTVAADRLADTSGVTLDGGASGAATFIYQGSSLGGSALHTETAGPLSFTGAHRSIVTLLPGAESQVELRFQSLLHQDHAVGLVRAALLGSAAGTEGSSRIFFETAPELTGGIVPWLIVDAAATGSGSSFATYDGSRGLTSLTAFVSPQAASFGDNVKKQTAGALTLASSLTVNSWSNSATGNTTLAAGTTLSIQSGAFLFTATGTLTGGGVIELGHQTGIFHLAGETGITARINNTLAGVGGLVLSGTGAGNKILTLAGNNSFTGGVWVYSGILNVLSAGALNADGSNALTVQSGGTVRLNGNSLTITELAGAGTINSNSGETTATLTVAGGGSFSGSLANGAAGSRLALTKTGNNVLTLGGTASFTGGTLVAEGTLQLNATGGNPGTNGRLTATESITVLQGATLRINKGNGAGSSNHADRLSDTAPVSLAGGTLTLSVTGSNIVYSELVGELHLLSGASQVTSGQAGVDGTSVLSVSGIASRMTGATLNFGGTALGTSLRNRTEIYGQAEGFMGGWATVGNEFAKYAPVAETGLFSVTAFTAEDSFSGEAGLWTAATHAKPLADQGSAQGLGGSVSIQSLNLGSGIDLNLAGGSLTIASGGLLKQAGNVNGTGPSVSQIVAGTLTSATDELFVRVTGANLTIAAQVTDNTGAGPLAVVKGGAGTLILTGANSFSGGVYVNEGTLRANNADGSATGSGSVWAAKGSVIGGTGYLIPGTGENITVNGTLAPGNLNDTAARRLTLQLSGVSMFTLGGSVLIDLFAGGSADLLSVAAESWANLSFGSGALLQVVTAQNSQSFEEGDSWQIFDWNGLAATDAEGIRPEFSAYALPVLSSGLYWDTSALFTTGMIAVVTPEPGRSLLLVVGALAVLGRRRRRCSR